jgi:hypothetical protein
MSSTARLACARFCSCWVCAADRRTDSSRSRPSIGLGDLAELHPDVALARIRTRRCASCAGAPRSSRHRSFPPIRAEWRARADRCRSEHRTPSPRIGGDVTEGRPDPAGSEDIGVAMPERIRLINWGPLLSKPTPEAAAWPRESAQGPGGMEENS